MWTENVTKAISLMYDCHNIQFETYNDLFLKYKDRMKSTETDAPLDYCNLFGSQKPKTAGQVLIDFLRFMKKFKNKDFMLNCFDIAQINSTPKEQDINQYYLGKSIVPRELVIEQITKQYQNREFLKYLRIEKSNISLSSKETR